MNEQIRKLMVEAGKTIPGDKQIDADFCKKFAELLVGECANFVENIFDDDGGHATCEDYAKGIKQHFGVEE